MGTDEPFGLPKGTVRGVLALGFSSVTLFLWATAVVVPNELLALTSLIVGNYFGSRGSTPSSAPAEVLGPPLIPGDPIK